MIRNAHPHPKGCGFCISISDIKWDDRRQLEEFSADTITREIRRILQKRKHILLGVVGGRSVEGIYSLLIQQKLDWVKIHIFLLDERKVPLFSNESNAILVKKYFKKANTHYFDFKHRTIKDYEKEFFSLGKTFDLVVLSVGEEGHIASLFPHHDSIKNNHNGFIEVNDSPKPPTERISATHKLLEKSGMAFLLFFGKEKKKAFENFLDDHIKVEECPAKIVRNVKESFVLVETDQKQTIP